MQYTKKPVTVEAFQYTDSGAIPEWFREAVEKGVVLDQNNTTVIQTPECARLVNEHDYVVKDTDGQLFPCEPDIFHATYSAEDDYLSINHQPVRVEDVKKFTDDNNVAHISIKLQSGPVKEHGTNGLQIDDVIAIVKNILQSFNEAYPCRETSSAITNLEEAKMWCDARTANRTQRGVEGKSED